MAQQIKRVIGAGTTGVSPTDFILEIDSTLGAVAILLPPAAVYTETQRRIGGINNQNGFNYRFNHIAGANPVMIIAGDALDKINGAASVALPPMATGTITLNDDNAWGLSVASIGGGGSGDWIYQGNFKFSDWQPNDTTTGSINIISIPANMVIDAIAIRKNVQFTPSVFINVVALTFYFSTADSTPPHIFLISNLRGSSGLGKVNFSYHSPEPGPSSPPDSESSAPNITAPYFLVGQIETNNGEIDDLIDGNFDLWYKISVIPTI